MSQTVQNVCKHVQDCADSEDHNMKGSKSEQKGIVTMENTAPITIKN